MFGDQSDFFIVLEMNDGVEREGECEFLGQAGRGCDSVIRRRDCETVSRAGGRESVPQVMNQTLMC